jgi:hypothetical protein
MKMIEAKTFGKISTRNSKMPGTTFAIDAFACKTGSILAKTEGTPCHGCYARRIQKMRPSVDKGWKDNLERWHNSHPKSGRLQLQRNYCATIRMDIIAGLIAAICKTWQCCRRLLRYAMPRHILGIGYPRKSARYCAIIRQWAASFLITLLCVLAVQK